LSCPYIETITANATSNADAGTTDTGTIGAAGGGGIGAAGSVGAAATTGGNASSVGNNTSNAAGYSGVTTGIHVVAVLLIIIFGV